MNEKIAEFVAQIKANRRIETLDEAATKQAVILRLLSLLNWDTYDPDEVTPEYTISGKRVDYSLRSNGGNKLFIEVKRMGLELENHQEQLLNYSFQQGVKLAILTNGITWWFYLPLNEGSWEQRKFYTIDVLEQEIIDIVPKFISFLSKNNVLSGAAVANAEGIYRDQQKNKIFEKTLPKAWNKLIEEADELLLELINETAEKICGYKAETEMIEAFLAKNRNSLLLTIHGGPAMPSRSSSQQDKKMTIPKSESMGNYTGKTISSFVFCGVKYDVRSWKELLIKLCETIVSYHKSDYQKALSIVGRRRPYFTHSPNELRAPQKIAGSDIYVETNLSANNIVKICMDMLAIFSYEAADFSIEAS